MRSGLLQKTGKFFWFGWLGKLANARVVLPGLAFFIAWGMASWFLAEGSVTEKSQRLVEREQDIATSTAASIGVNVGLSLAQMRTIPTVLAKQPEVERILAHIGPHVTPLRLPQARARAVLAADPGPAALGHQLELLVRELNVDRIMVLNAAGDCVAAGGFTQEISPIGINYADRPYFRMAREQGKGRQFAVGRTTDVPGLFYSSAVFRGKVFLGVVLIKIDLSRLLGKLNDRNIFVTDELGVVVAAGDPAYYMRATPASRIDALDAHARENRYRRQAFPVLEISPLRFNGLDFTRLSGREAPMLGAVSGQQTDILKVWVYRDMSELRHIGREGTLVFALLFLAGSFAFSAVLTGWLHFRRSKAHQQAITKANAELLKLNQELLIQARFDVLTGCCNRRYFFEGLALEMKRAARFGLPVCLAALDIDHFKQVNDRYGHARGDDLLRLFAETVGRCLRASDVLGRIGGEEFVVMMPQTALSGAIDLAERIRVAVAAATLTSGEHVLQMTVSSGVVQWRGEGESIEALVARADEVMYAAKHAGRNRVCAESMDTPA